MRRKKEEQDARNSLIDLNPLKASTVSDRPVREEAEEVVTNWDYEFVKGEAEYKVVWKFKRYVEAIVARIIDELGLTESRRHYKPVKQTLSEIVY